MARKLRVTTKAIPLATMLLLGCLSPSLAVPVDALPKEKQQGIRKLHFEMLEKIDSAKTFIKQKKYSEAILDCDDAIRLGKQSYEVDCGYRGKGDVLMDAGKPKEAMKAYTLAIKSRPWTLNYSSRAKAYEKLKDYDKAIEDYTRALETVYRTDLRCDLWSARSECYEKSGQQSKAIDDAKRVYSYFYFSVPGSAKWADAKKRIEELTGNEPQAPTMAFDKGKELVLLIGKLATLEGKWTLDDLKSLTGEQLVLESPSEYSHNYTFANVQGPWIVHFRPSEGAIAIDWEPDLCCVRLDDLEKAIGPMPLRMTGGSRCLPLQYWTLNQKEWGKMKFTLGSTGYGESVALNAVFTNR